MKIAAKLLMATLWIALFLGGCAAAPELQRPQALLHDEWFGAPDALVQPDDAMAVSPEMRSYLSTRLGNVTRFGDAKQRLVDALFRQGELRLEYDASQTRTAAQAFDARSGNCLALVMMTAALAKQLGLPVRFQLVLGDEAWDRTADPAIDAQVQFLNAPRGV